MDKQEIIKELWKIFRYGTKRSDYKKLLYKIGELAVNAEVKASFDIKRGEK